MLDPNFRQSVVLLLQQGEEGAMGVVVNRVSPLRLSDLAEDHEIAYRGKPDIYVRAGGPVSPEHGLVLYGSEHEELEGQKVVEDLHVSASKESLVKLCSLPGGRFHCYSGHAGWGPGQLEREIGEGTWVVAPASAKTILDTPPGEIWSAALRAQGIDPAAMVPGGDREA